MRGLLSLQIARADDVVCNYLRVESFDKGKNGGLRGLEHCEV